jgi:hypothetical protein
MQAPIASHRLAFGTYDYISQQHTRLLRWTSWRNVHDKESGFLFLTARQSQFLR